MLTFVGNAHFYEQCTLLCAMHIFVSNAHFCVQCTFLCAMRFFMSNAHFYEQCSPPQVMPFGPLFLVCNAPLHRTQHI